MNRCLETGDEPVELDLGADHGPDVGFYTFCEGSGDSERDGVTWY